MEVISMAWKSVSPMDERTKFVLEAQLDLWTITDLCQRYGISRKTGYKWLNRFDQQGFDGLKERSRAPKRCAHRSAEDIVEQVLAQRKRHSKWGPKKIADALKRAGVDHVPAPSTIGNILQRHGMVRRRRRRAVGRWPAALTKAQHANHVWAVDFKGWFRTGNGQRCDPFTASDLYSRFVLECCAVESQSMQAVGPICEQMFDTYGLPQVIRADNGAPFGARGPLGLSRLSMWWIQLGIRVEFIEPGHPQQNSVHERMHRTLKEETCCPPKWNQVAQQQRFDQWRDEFNNQRPHEALEMRYPAEVYKISAKSYQGGVEPFSYPGYFEVRHVRQSGQIVLNGVPRFIGHAFCDLDVGLQPVNSRQYLVHAGPLILGSLDIEGKKPMHPTVSRETNCTVFNN